MVGMNFIRLLALSTVIHFVSSWDIYVSSDGSDANDATAGKPCKSLQQAQRAVRKALHQGHCDDVTVHIGDGTYFLPEPLNFTGADSGCDGKPVRWTASGSNAVISGGTKVTEWTLNETSGIYSAAVPKGIQSRNLFVNGWASNYARRMINRTDFEYTNFTMTWNSSAYDWLMTTPGIAGAEIRAISSFTDRYAPIEAVGDRELIMLQDCWQNQVIGYDTIPQPNADFGVWVQNALSLLHEGGQFYLDSGAGTVYYMPLVGEDMSTAETYLGTLEALVILGGTYDDPIHDVSFEGLNFQHTTWLKPSQGYGYVDQQTGGYIGDNTTYPQFEASRPHWYQMPSAIQIYAAQNISFSGGSYTQLGSGGFGIGNDPTAYTSGTGLGAQLISVADGYFTQVMGNSIMAGGIQANGHHPSDPRMVNSQISLTGNIFYNISSLFSSTVPIFVSYIQYSEISHNDIFTVPYSAICHGYGWGSNDAGGSQTYINRGLYNYQPLYNTPTTSLSNLIQANLIHAYGLSHTDLGATYTLSKSPSTLLTENYVFNSSWYGFYTDEGSNSYTATKNDYLSNGNWYAPNQGCPTCGVHTANNTLIDNFGHVGSDEVNFPDGSGIFNNTFISNYVVTGLAETDEEGHRVAYRAGVLPGKRGSRAVSNPPTPDTYISLNFPPTLNGGQVTANISNFDDSDFTAVSISTTVSGGYSLAPVSVPGSIPADSFALASWTLKGSSCTPPLVTISMTYTNGRTQATNTVSITGTAAGNALQQSTLSTSSAWAASFGQLCNSTLGIRTGGRDIGSPYDDWAAIYKPSALGSNGSSVTAQVLSLDPVDPSSKAGVVVRNSLATNGTTSNLATGYAVVVVIPSNGLLFQWDASGDGLLDSNATVSGITAPVGLRISLLGSSYNGYYSTNNGSSWIQIGGPVQVNGSTSLPAAGIIATSHSGFNNATAIFGGLSFA